MESDRDVYSHPPSATYFWKGSRQTPQKITKALSALKAEQSAINLRFADDIDGLAREEEELAK